MFVVGVAALTVLAGCGGPGPGVEETETGGDLVDSPTAVTPGTDTSPETTGDAETETEIPLTDTETEVTTTTAETRTPMATETPGNVTETQTP